MIDKAKMHVAKEGWEARTAALAVPENFRVTVIPNPSLLGKLTWEEQDRLKWKLDLVKDAAQRLAAAMVKGTVKYPNDLEDPDAWIAHLIDEGVDQLNYQFLLVNAYNRAKK